MIRSNRVCVKCGTRFSVDLDKDDSKCPKCGSISKTDVQSTKISK